MSSQELDLLWRRIRNVEKSSREAIVFLLVIKRLLRDEEKDFKTINVAIEHALVKLRSTENE